MTLRADGVPEASAGAVAATVVGAAAAGAAAGAAFGAAAATGWLLVLASLLLALFYLRGLYREMFGKHA